MKIVQIGCAGHAFLAYDVMMEKQWNLSAISSGIRGNEAEHIDDAYEGLLKRGFSPKLYSDYKVMLSEEKPDIAIINSFFNDNGELALYAVEQGINVFCEKPIAVSYKALENIYLTAKKNNVIVGAMFNYRFCAEFVAAKKAIAEGKIGRVRLMDSRKSYKLGTRPEFYKTNKYYCGIIPWVAVHAIDWMSWLSGESYISVSAISSNICNGDNGDMDIIAAAQFELTNSTIATVTADMYRPKAAKTHGDDRVRIVGTEGIIEVGDGIVKLITREDNYELPLEAEKSVFEYFVSNIGTNEGRRFMETSIISTFWALCANASADKSLPLNKEIIGKELKNLVFP